MKVSALTLNYYVKAKEATLALAGSGQNVMYLKQVKAVLYLVMRITAVISKPWKSGCLCCGLS
jgi:hypothetical protein